MPKPLTDILHVLSTDPQIEAIFRAVGEALEGRTLQTVLAGQIEQLNRDIILERRKAGAEFDRLNKLISDERDAARMEMDRLNGEIASDRQTAGLEIERLNQAIRDERAAAKTELERLETVHINTVRSLEHYSEETSALRAALNTERSLSQDLIELQKKPTAGKRKGAARDKSRLDAQ